VFASFQTLIDDLLDLFVGVRFEDQSVVAHPRVHFSRQSLREIHGVCDYNEPQFGSSMGYPLEQVIKDLLIFGE
jgi:hypothetical protein